MSPTGKYPAEEEMITDDFAERAPFARRRLACAYGLRAALLVALLPLGSTGRFAMPLATLVLAAWCLLASLLVPVRSRVAMLALFTALALALFIVLQSLPGAPVLPAAPIWQDASRLLGEELGATAASVAPTRTLATLPVIVVPVLVFALAIGVFEEEASALSMMKFMAMTGTAVALFGLAQFAFSPGTVLIFTKPSYLDSLTAVFVNRNSAATFLGLTLLLLIALLFAALRRRPLVPTLLGIVSEPSRHPNGGRIFLLLVAAFVVVLALFLTKSRAGVGATGAAALALVLCFGAGGRRGLSSVRRALDFASWLAALGLLGSATVAIFGQQTVRRAMIHGMDDTRFCIADGLWRAARDYWPNGSGAGTFALVFPAYRDPKCGIYGVIDRAHNFFLEGAITLGLPFVTLTGAVICILATVLLRGVVRRRRFRFIPAAGFAVLVLLVLHDLVDFSLQIPGIAIWSAALLALCCSVATAHLPRKFHSK